MKPNGPDWEKWNLIGTVKLWQGIALVLDMEPDNLPGRPRGNSPLSLDRCQCPESFKNLLQAALVDGSLETKTMCAAPAYRPTQTLVGLGDLGEWAVSKGIRLPQGFPQQGDREAHSEKGDEEDDLADLFDPVGSEQLETMFPDGKKWKMYADRAKREGLIAARVGRGKFNPYKAAVWWLDKKTPAGWDLDKCIKTLAKNLPERSRDSKHLLTGDF